MNKQVVLKWRAAGIVSGVFLITLCTFWQVLHTPPDVTKTPPALPQVSNVAHAEQGTVFADDDYDMVATPWRTDEPFSGSNLVPSSDRIARSPTRLIKYVTINDKIYPLRTYRPLMQPNDPMASQWWVTNAKLDLAWDITPGNYQTTLAVIDSGFALNHEDLRGRWYQNGAEQGLTSQEAPSQLNCTDKGLTLAYSCNLVDDDVDGLVDNEIGAAPYENPSRLNCSAQGIPLDKKCNRLDDDANGFIDDVSGWDAINQDNSPQAGELSPLGTNTTHGTMVAGVAAATGNNSKGISGVNWQTLILPVQALDDDGYGDTRSVGQAIRYAVMQHVDVINISLGTDFQDDYVREAIEMAAAAGITVVASSGNDGCDCVVYPARYPEVIAVGALDTTGARASFSSWGAAVDITAPGTNMTLPSWSNANQTGRYVSGAAGTSFSSPLVAGLATLLKSHQPAAMPLHIVAALRETANRSNNSLLALPDTGYGYGKVDALLARQRMTTPRHDLQAYVFSPVNAGSYFDGQSLEFGDIYKTGECFGVNASMPVYELKKNATTFFSISDVEVQKAQVNGYSITRFAHGCLLQPHDTADSTRYLNIFREFKNISIKP